MNNLLVRIALKFMNNLLIKIALKLNSVILKDFILESIIFFA